MFNNQLESVPLVDPGFASKSLPKLPQSQTPSKVQAPPAHKSDEWEYSVVNERLVLRGDLESDDDVLVKGKVYGNISCKLLIIDTGARVEGAITAQDVVVRGSTKGSIRAHRVRLESTAVVASDIHHASFCAEEGARVHGSLTFTDGPTSGMEH